MRSKVYIDYTGTGYVEAFPDNVEPFKINREKDQFFKRYGWGKVGFSNDPDLYAVAANDVYRLFDIISELSLTQRIKIKHETTLLTIEGYFGSNECKFDNDRKSFEITPAILDVYSDVLENWESEIDFSGYAYDEVPITFAIDQDTVFTKADWKTDESVRNRVKNSDYTANGELSLFFDGDAPKEELFSDSYWSFSDAEGFYLSDRQAILGETGSPSLDISKGDYELSEFTVYEGTRTGGLSQRRWRNLYCTTKFTRDKYRKIDVYDGEGELEPPPGDDWHERDAIFIQGQPAHNWTRKPFAGAYSNSWVKSAEESNSEGWASEFTWYKKQKTSIDYPESGDSSVMQTTILLSDFLTHIYQNTSPDLSVKTVQSTFFFNDNEGLLPILDGKSGYNYVSLDTNKLNDSRIVFTKDLQEDLGLEQVSEIPKITLKEMLEDLNRTFANNLYWFIDSSQNLHIEHIKYLDLTKDAVDLRGEPLQEFTSNWSYDKSGMFNRIELSQINSAFVDFTDNLIEFDKIVSNNRNRDIKLEIQTEILSTDLRYAIQNPTDIDDGVIYFAADEDNNVINQIGAISGKSETNGYLALSNILTQFGRYEGVWENGIINGTDYTFENTSRTKLQGEIVFKGLKDSLFFITDLGYGIVEDGTIDFEKENTKLKLRYRYNSEPETDQFVLITQSDIWFDFGNYET